ncbi:Arsenate reductase, glutaredoxin family [Roseovarius marisflavi]|uniref:Arsenate reductase, glutaredoxin family n=1 Tax=Roseovarius marisflavi TaxID=1054996 RepID=A0A1M7CUC2_9RHOB|nr:glutaredoxin domain-containing protein [Roseovarius marisflavi]SHL70851.1 Arsenate reductase, glutaredoxin family [Roseovarius marisflavi]
MIIYGISTCPASRRARKTLEAAGHAVEFRDVRAEPMSEAEWAELIAEFGERLVDRKSTEWHGLSDWLKHAEADAQLTAKPKLMVSPVIRNGESYYLGWDDTIEAALLAG